MTNAEVFAARLARIQEGAPNTKGTIFVGQDERFHPGPRPGAEAPRARAASGAGLNPLALLLAFGLGLFGVGLGVYARFHLMPGQELANPDLEMAASVGLGLALSLVLAHVLRLRSVPHKLLQAAGALAMVCGVHNLAHWAPVQMAALLSPAWVQQAQSGSPANSVQFRGVYFPLRDTAPPAEAPAEPIATAQVAADACAAGKPGLITMDSAGQTAQKAPCAGN